MEDTFVRCGEVLVEGPVEDVGYIRAEGVTSARVHGVLSDLFVRHAGALKSQALVSKTHRLEDPLVMKTLMGLTCRTLRDLLMSPDANVTMAFIPSGVTSMLSRKKVMNSTISAVLRRFHIQLNV